MVGARDSKDKGDCSDEEALGIKGRTKRKRQWQRFEIFKRFCEEVVEKLMVQQEEMHNKLLDDLVKRDAEMIAREEEWKRREMDRINKELDARANEQAIAGNRQATVIELLEKFTSSMSNHKIPCPIHDTCKGGDGQSLPSIPSNNCTVCTSAQPAQKEVSTLDCKSKDTKTAPVSDKRIPQATEDSHSGRKDRTPTIPGSCRHKDPEPPAATKVDDRETGSKRWPRDEVQALINLRSAINNREKAEHNRISGSHGEMPLWERVSRGMTELGYRRSAKRCKEKWENINKYFRKTRDVRKKKSAESRTCPYFQQLSSLYGQSDRVMPRPPTADKLGPGDAGDGAV
ncbi:hypothetical protein MLD38_023688 [Melastoma candidum]|nr:hypothetical protein MLD38_023688 [Melastoma candidum]